MIELNIENLIYKRLVGEDSELYEIVEVTTIDFDGEKGCVNIEIIIKHKKNETFWKCIVTDWGMGIVELYDDWEQVYPHEIKKIIFKSKPA